MYQTIARVNELGIIECIPVEEYNRSMAGSSKTNTIGGKSTQVTGVATSKADSSAGHTLVSRKSDHALLSVPWDDAQKTFREGGK